MGKKENYEDEEMTVDIELETGETVNCAIITILEVDGRDYIVLLPLDEDGENEDGEVWFYRYSENPDDPNEEPELEYIEDDDEYENVAEAFDEYLDNCEFDAIDIAESAMRKLAVKRHLTAFKSRTNSAAGASFHPFVTATGGLSVSASDPATETFVAVR